MDNWELIKQTKNSLLYNRLRSFLTTLGIIIGVFAIILLVSIGSGLQSYIEDQITGLGSNLIFVIPGRIGGARTPGGVASNKLLVSDARNIQIKLRGLATVAPVIQQTSTIRYKNKENKAASVFGTTSNYPKTIKNATINLGNFFTLSQEQSGSKVAVIGQTVYHNLFGDSNPLGNRIFIGNNVYTVIGVLNKRGSIFGVDQDNVVIIPLSSAQRQFGLTHVNTIFISVNNSSLINTVKKETEKLLLRRLGEDDFTLQTAESTLSILNNITNILSISLGGIAAISLLVGGIGVANIMLVSVTERTKEIGLRKAIGAKRRDILKQFLLEAVVLSVAGGAIGIILGLFASLILAQFFVSKVTPWSIFLAFSFSASVGIIFGMAPAIKASKLTPIEALRYE